MNGSTNSPSSLLTRRRAIGIFGGVGLGAVAAACGGSGSTAAGAGSSTTTTGTNGSSTTAASAAVSCILTPEVTEGPYYLDINKVRSDITEGRDGAPLALTIRVLDATTCRPIKDAAVDIWHCDALGVYSGFQSASIAANGGGPPGGGDGAAATDSAIFLRGTQVSDTDGNVTFASIYPGWYTGRAVHIHMKVHVKDTVRHVGQLFFDEGLTDAIYRGSPYNSHTGTRMMNAADSIYAGAGKAFAIVDTVAKGAGYAGTITVGLREGQD